MLAPWFADGALSMVFAAAPLLAQHQGVGVIFLSSMSVIAQTVRLPLCLIAGKLSERLGRKQVSITAAILTLIGCIGLATSQSAWTTCLFFALCVASMGAFYPPLQAFIGDVSGPGRLAKNLGAFNVGWCVGSAVAAQIAARLLKLGFAQTFLCSAVFIIIAMLVLVLWKKPKELTAAEVENVAPPKVIPGNDIWLLIGRFGHFTGFFGYAAIRIIFPELGKALHWTDPEKASITGFLLWGLGTGIFITGISPWWRGKIWPQLAAHAGMAASAVGMGIFQDKILLGASFLVFGTCMAICYTTAIYHGLAARSKMGRNMGIHEALVAAGQISGSIIGGIAAQQLGLRSPYFILAGVAACAMISSAWLYTTKLKNIESLEATT